MIQNTDNIICFDRNTVIAYEDFKYIHYIKLPKSISNKSFTFKFFGLDEDIIIKRWIQSVKGIIKEYNNINTFSDFRIINNNIMEIKTFYKEGYIKIL